jgi:hypothetical protein
MNQRMKFGLRDMVYMKMLLPRNMYSLDISYKRKLLLQNMYLQNM